MVLFLILGFALVVLGATIAFVPMYVLGSDNPVYLFVGAILMWIGIMTAVVSFLSRATRPAPPPDTRVIPPRAAPYGPLGAPPSPRLVATLGFASFLVGAGLLIIAAIAGIGALGGIGLILSLAGALLLATDVIWIRTRQPRRTRHTTPSGRTEVDDERPERPHRG